MAVDRAQPPLGGSIDSRGASLEIRRLLPTDSEGVEVAVSEEAERKLRELSRALLARCTRAARRGVDARGLLLSAVLRLSEKDVGRETLGLGVAPTPSSDIFTATVSVGRRVAEVETRPSHSSDDDGGVHSACSAASA